MDVKRLPVDVHRCTPTQAGTGVGVSKRYFRTPRSEQRNASCKRTVSVVGAGVRLFARSCGGWRENLDAIELAVVAAQLEDMVRAVSVESVAEDSVCDITEVDRVRAEYVVLPRLFHVDPPLQPLPVLPALGKPLPALDSTCQALEI